MQSIPVISYTRLVKLAEGFFAEVFKVTDSDMVIKIPKSGASHLHDIEKRIYERIGDHQGILPYYGEWQITEASGKVRLGLCFAYEPGGTLRELLLERDTHPLLEHLITLSVVSQLLLLARPRNCWLTTDTQRSKSARDGAISYSRQGHYPWRYWNP